MELCDLLIRLQVIIDQDAPIVRDLDEDNAQLVRKHGRKVVTLFMAGKITWWTVGHHLGNLVVSDL